MKLAETTLTLARTTTGSTTHAPIMLALNVEVVLRGDGSVASTIVDATGPAFKGWSTNKFTPPVPTWVLAVTD